MIFHLVSLLTKIQEMFMIFDEIDRLTQKKKINLHDKCVFLAMVPDVTLSMNCDTTPEAIRANYTDDDIKELFRYCITVH